jgi:hypothetical protein
LRQGASCYSCYKRGSDWIALKPEWENDRNFVCKAARESRLCGLHAAPGQWRVQTHLDVSCSGHVSLKEGLWVGGGREGPPTKKSRLSDMAKKTNWKKDLSGIDEIRPQRWLILTSSGTATPAGRGKASLASTLPHSVLGVASASVAYACVCMRMHVPLTPVSPPIVVVTWPQSQRRRLPILKQQPRRAGLAASPGHSPHVAPEHPRK